MANSLVFTTTDINLQSQVENEVKEQSTINLVLLHGWGLNSGVWQPLIESLKAALALNTTLSLKVITIDLPGFGLNANKSVTPYTLHTVANKVFDSVQKATNEPAIFMGWSLGGLVATEIAHQFPDKVSGLITVASTPYFVAEQENENNAGWPGIKKSVLKSFHNQLQNDIEKTIKGFLKIQAMGSPSLRQDIKHITKLIMAYDLPSKETLENSLDLLDTCDLRTVLSEINVPILQLYGQTDGLVPKQVIPLIKELNPSSEQVVFPKASHAPFISHLDDFTLVILNWLNKQTAMNSSQNH
ncbi:MAG: pimeloyl-ACP methyl ester esterase BioH [Colwellia sp.]